MYDLRTERYGFSAKVSLRVLFSFHQQTAKCTVLPGEGTMTSEQQEKAQYYSMFPGVKLWVHKGATLLNTYSEVADDMENFEVRDDDVWIGGHSKSGTSWTREMVWHIMNDFKLEPVSTPLSERIPLIEFSGLFKCEVNLSDDKDSSKEKAPDAMENSIKFVKDMPSPRLIATHLPFQLLPRQLRTKETKAKIIYVARNPKDVCISSYHFNKLLGVYSGSFEDYCEMFLNDQIVMLPFWDHVRAFWERRNDDNILFLKYEDMKANFRREIKRTAEFLGKNCTDEQISKLEEYLSFENMKKNPVMNREDMVKVRKNPGGGQFMRKGQANQWKTVMSKEMIERFDNWTREKLKDNESLLREFS